MQGLKRTNLFFFSFLLTMSRSLWGLSSPTRDWTLGHGHWKHWTLFTRPPGNSQNSSVAFRMLTWLHNHHGCLIPEHFHHPQKKPCSPQQSPCSTPPSFQPPAVITWKWKWSRSVVPYCSWPHGPTYQAPLSMGFSRQECWNGLPFPSRIFFFFGCILYSFIFPLKYNKVGTTF